MSHKKIYKFEDIELETYLFGDTSKGKTLTITAGVHGCEYVPILAAKKIIKLLENINLNGAVKIVPLINKSGFYNGIKQLSKEDSKNLNRCFPGDKNGTYTQKLAYLIEKEVYPETDFLIDLHAGDIDEYAFPFVFFPVAAGLKIEEKSRNGAKSMPISLRVESRSKNGLYSHAAQCGIAGLLMEWGGLGKYSEKEVDECVDAIFHLMNHLDILQTKPFENENQFEVKNAQYIESIDQGFWYCNVTGGDYFKKGDILGILKNYNDTVLQEVVAIYDGQVLYSSNSLGVTKSYPLVAYGENAK